MPLIPPGSTIGVLGSGQLGRMFAIAARRMGYRVHVYSPDDDTPTGQVADVEIKAAYEDVDQLAAFARNVAVVTFEFENVPSIATETVEKYAPVRPAGSVLHTLQNRLREKTFLRDRGLPVTPFAAIRTGDDISAALREIGVPAILKTAAWGYDGKGQVKVEAQPGIDDTERLQAAWNELGSVEAILERRIDFDCEISVVGARGVDGQAVCYTPFRNLHERHILDISVSPCVLGETLIRNATDIARDAMQALELVGVLCVEMFVTREGNLLINELAPRPHNSGHLTIDAFGCCQFEQQVRGVCGLPLGRTRQLRPAAMANLLGDLWFHAGEMSPTRELNWQRALRAPETRLHLYGKREPRRLRKMGHITALADTAEQAVQRVAEARRALLE